MSSATQPDRNAQPFKVLSLDDGGIGGLSSLLILEKIMENIRDAEGLPDIPRPCEKFDLIGGTGTGGIAAIMLGRLGMSIDDCIKAYKELCNAAFAPGEQIWPMRIRTKSTSSILTANLENALKKAIRENCPVEQCAREREEDASRVNTCRHEDEKFLDKKCPKTAVLATTKVNIDARPILFRTILINEAKELLSGQQEMLILSIGTGLSSAIEMGNTKRSIRRSLEKMATSSRRVETELKTEHSSEPQKYYRFNTANGLESFAASDWVEPSEVAAHTKNYLNEQEADIKRFSKVLINGFTLVSGNPVRPDESDGSVPVYHIPFHENLKFVGRQDILSQLDDKLFTRTGFQQVALVGLGGMGKTQVALKFAYTVKNKYADYSVFWLTAATIDGFRNSCKELAAALGIDASDREDPRILVKNYLDANVCGKWLLVLDNVDDASLFNALAKENRIGTFLPQSDQGRIMFTTRSKSVSWLAVKTDSLELEEMSSEELTTILMRSMEVHNNQSHIHDEHSINELLDELCHRPLAVAQAADYMAINQIPVAEYLELLRDSNEEKVELLTHHHPDNVHLEDSQGAVATTWFITFRHIQKTSSDAVDLLRFIAKVEAKAIPQTMFPVSEKKKSMVDAIGVLLAFGFIRRQMTNGLFDMHSLVHWTTQLWSEGLEDDEEHTLNVVGHIASIFPSDEWENRFLWRQYLPHALCVVKHEEASGESMTELEFKIGLCLRRDGNIRDAVRMLDHVVKRKEKTLAADHPSYLMCQHALAKAYLDDGQTEKAVSTLEHLVKTDEKALAADHPSRLTFQYALASAYLRDGQTEKAVSMLEHVVKTEEKALAADHPDRLKSQQVLATAYLDDGQTKKAVSMLEHVVKTQEKALAADHPSRLASQHGLARAYLDDGQTEKAVSVFEHVVKTKEKALAADHPSRLASQHVLARAYLDDGQTEKAVPMLEHVVKTEEKALAADHPDRLVSQIALARAYYTNNQPQTAIELLQRVVKLDEISSSRNPKYRLQAKELLEEWLTLKSDSQDFSD
ncbi:putative acyl transferase acyl hydrolase lysophospholipase [Ceratocystis lukuohia]|uniref:Acyl transferase acyl hydrolase lysophospholipase n=1 Tax=Ceratocystis lukuohia TaxID=2019550 RepID=A0ABR4MCV6_9PEZI